MTAKAECQDGGTNLRFIVTTRLSSSKSNRPSVVSPDDGQREYDDYIQRGKSEYRMDELKNGLRMNRSSYHRFIANFFRLLLHTAAFKLHNAVRDDTALSEVLRVCQPRTWQRVLITVAAEIIQSTRRILVKVAGNWPWWPMYESVTARAVSFAPSQ